MHIADSNPHRAACCHQWWLDHGTSGLSHDHAATASRPPIATDRGPRGLACGYCVSPCGSRTACDLAGPCVAPVIHFSTATLVHSCGAVDQRVYVNHPQARTQDVSLAGPGAGVIGASSHAGPGSLCCASSSRPGQPRGGTAAVVGRRNADAGTPRWRDVGRSPVSPRAWRGGYPARPRRTGARRSSAEPARPSARATAYWHRVADPVLLGLQAWAMARKPSCLWQSLAAQPPPRCPAPCIRSLGQASEYA